MSVANPFDQSIGLKEQFDQLQNYVKEAVRIGEAIHQVEQQLWQRLLRLGYEALNLFLSLQGQGDIGERVTLSNGQRVHRLAKTHSRDYQSAFGAFRLERAVYGTREGQRIELVPLDARLQLPEGKFSYLLQDWDQSLAVESPYNSVNEMLSKMLGWDQSSDSLERMNRQMSTAVEPFRETQAAPPPATSADIVVASADGKGVPMRREADSPPILEHHHRKGPKPNRKKMAIVGAVYTTQPLVRTPTEVLDSLFRDPREPQSVPASSSRRPAPQHKRLRASLTLDTEAETLTGTDVIFEWMATELQQRHAQAASATVTIMDGQDALWTAADIYLPCHNQVEVLDLLHVTPRLWTVAHLFHPQHSDAAIAWVKADLKLILHGHIDAVLARWHQLTEDDQLTPHKCKQLQKAYDYLHKHQHRMQYDVYLAAGYPIASGVIEGACRYFVKDRMERAGMRWSVEGAQAMLDLRSIYLNGDWDEFTKYRIQRETERLYPFRDLVGSIDWPLPG